MHVSNLLERFKLEEGIDLNEPNRYLDGFWGNSFQVAIDGFQTSTFKQRVELIDRATKIEHQRLMNDENSWAITGLQKIGENWKAFDFNFFLIIRDHGRIFFALLEPPDKAPL